MHDESINILLVDDRPENLVALEGILEPLDVTTVRATSGEEALRELLHREFAVVLLDVQMPGMNGFETASFIKQRERTRHLPIIFLTAISKENEHVFAGYEAGAVDYLFKPFDPYVLRSKVTVFVELYRMRQQVQRQGELLRLAEQRARERQVSEVREREQLRQQALAEAMPQIAWRTDSDGTIVWVNAHWTAFTGTELRLPAADPWRSVAHPDDVDDFREVLTRCIRERASFEHEVRLRRIDGVWRWHLVRSLPLVRDGVSEGHVAAATDIHDRMLGEAAQRLLADAGEVLVDNDDVELTVRRIAELCVEGGHADICTIVVHPGHHSAGDDGSLIVHEHDDSGADRQRGHGAGGSLIVPIERGSEQVGELRWDVRDEAARQLDEIARQTAQQLAQRLASFLESARLARKLEERAEASQVLASVGDGVLLVDTDGIVRLANPAAAVIAGRAHEELVGQPASAVMPGWSEISARVRLVSPDDAGSGAPASTVPIRYGDREHWLSVSGVESQIGTVYALRDITEEQVVERLKSDFVATVSHELRTPLTSIYGAAVTLQRNDLELDDDTRDHLVGLITEQSSRLSGIIEELLVASRVDSGQMQTNATACPPAVVARDVIDSVQPQIPKAVELVLNANDGLPEVYADPQHLRQVLTNLVENAIKYSPAGGRVELSVTADNGSVIFAVRDEGIGIPGHEQRRVFEKFYRVDANMTRGIGGTGLGLYICRELVRQMGGRMDLESEPGEGSTFSVELASSTTDAHDS